jgi:hypothetical protein
MKCTSSFLLVFAVLLFACGTFDSAKADKRDFAVDTYYPTSNEIRLAEQRARQYWQKNVSRLGTESRYLAVTASSLLAGELNAELSAKLDRSETSASYFTQGISSSSKQGIRGVMIFDTQTGRSVGPQGYIVVDSPSYGQIVRVADYTARYIGAGGNLPELFPRRDSAQVKNARQSEISLQQKKERNTHPTPERPRWKYSHGFARRRKPRYQELPAQTPEPTREKYPLPPGWPVGPNPHYLWKMHPKSRNRRFGLCQSGSSGSTPLITEKAICFLGDEISGLKSKEEKPGLVGVTHNRHIGAGSAFTSKLLKRHTGTFH